jgi:predicted enzyme related to lactoylglutathione lyase
MTTSLVGVTIDCRDPEAMAQFWSALLGRPITDEMEGPGWATVGSRDDGLPRLTFQQVPEPKDGKVRLHLDVQVDEIEDGIATVERLGGHWTGARYEHDEGVVVTMTDPEDHEFCLVQYYAQ